VARSKGESVGVGLNSRQICGGQLRPAPLSAYQTNELSDGLVRAKTLRIYLKIYKVFRKLLKN
jgi:hypothetical protein